MNVPGEVGFFSPVYLQKSIFANKTIASLDTGFHTPKSKYSTVLKETEFSFIHFHNRNFHETVELAKQKLAHLIDIQDLENLKKYQGNGHHLVKYFFATENEYYNWYRNNGNIYFYRYQLICKQYLMGHMLILDL